MDTPFDLFFNMTEEGLTYGIMAVGMYTTYWILGSPDPSVDGTFLLGARVTGALIAAGANPWVACPVAFLVGVAAGCATGLLHARLCITDLLSGILVMTGLWSANLVMTRGSVVLLFYNKLIIFTSGPVVRLMPPGMQDYRVIPIMLLVVTVVKVLLGPYLKARSGLLFRVSDSNSQYAISLGKDPGQMKIAGLAISNGYVALTGSILAQQTETANIYGGTDIVVMALVSVIISTSLFGRIRFTRPAAMVTIGAILYKTYLVIVMQLGLPTNYLKLPTTLLFTLTLTGNQVFSGGKKYPHVVNPTQI